MNEPDLYEPEYKAVLRKSVDFTNTNMENAFDYVQTFSKIEDINNKFKDLLKVQNDGRIKSGQTEFSYSRSSSNVSSMSMSYTEEERRMSLSGLYPSAVPNPNMTNFLKVRDILSNFDNFDFNIFALNDLLEKRTCLFLASEIFSSLKFFDSLLKESTFNNFLKHIIEGYSRKVPYHNDLHAADTLQTIFVMLDKGQLTNNLKLNDIDTFSVLVAAIVHDYKHPGQTNAFQVNDKSLIALSYNGIL